MLTHEQLKEKALTLPGVRSEYERLEREEFSLLDILLTARQEVGLTQADIAVRLGTQPSAITRLERSLASGKHSPSIATLRKYLAAYGKQLVLKTELA